MTHIDGKALVKVCVGFGAVNVQLRKSLWQRRVGKGGKRANGNVETPNENMELQCSKLDVVDIVVDIADYLIRHKFEVGTLR